MNLENQVGFEEPHLPSISIAPESPAFPEQNFEAKYHATQQVLQAVSDFASFPETAQDDQQRFDTYTQKLRQLLDKLVQLSQPDQLVALQQYNKLVITLYDLFIMDEMKSDSADKIMFVQNTYARGERLRPSTSYAQKELLNSPESPDILYFTHQECTVLRQKLEADSHIYQVQNATEFLNLSAAKFIDRGIVQVYIHAPIQFSELEAVRNHYQLCIAELAQLTKNQPRPLELPVELSYLAAHFNLDQKYAGIVTINVVPPQISPVSPIARQDLYLSLLNLGQPFGAAHLVSPRSLTPPKPLPGETLSLAEFQAALSDYFSQLPELVRQASIAKQLLANKASIFLSPDSPIPEEKLVEQLTARELQRYDRFLNRTHPIFGSGQIFITRSGVSANNAVEQALHDSFLDESSDKLDHAFQQNWYYENNLEHRFNLEENIQDVRFFFLNYDPSTPTYDSPDEYRKEQAKLINYAKQLAFRTPSESYVVVLEKTNDLLATSFFSLDDLPPNLYFIETASLTKYKKGDQNHFGGAVVCWGPPWLKQAIAEHIVPACGTLTEMNALNLSNISSVDIRIHKDQMARKALLFKQGLMQKTSLLPAYLHPFLENYTFFSYFELPLKSIFLLINQIKNSGTRNFLSSSNMEEYLREYKLDAQSIYDHLTKNFADKGSFIEGGDSYGLDATRLNLMNGYAPDPIPTHSEPDRKIPLKTLRISWGRKTSYEAVKELGKQLSLYYEEMIMVLLHLAQQKRQSVTAQNSSYQ